MTAVTSSDPAESDPKDADKPKIERTTISAPTELIEAAKKKAIAQHRSFSAYLAVLIEQDLKNEL